MKFFLRIILLVFFATCAVSSPTYASDEIYISKPIPHQEGDRYQVLENDVIIQTKDGRQFDFEVELALRGDEQEKGLMFRQHLAEDAGMLFIFRASQKRTFWMKNTYIPLDIIFLETNGKIQHIHSMAKPQSLAAITSDRPSKAVLEVKGGVTDKLGIKAGDIVHHSAFKNLNLIPQ